MKDIDVNKITDKKRLRLHKASLLRGGHPTDLIINKQIQKTALHLAVEGGHKDVVRVLLADPRVDVNVLTVEDWKVCLA